MTFLPIVQRELREGSRRKSTFRIRWWTAVIALTASICVLPFIWATNGMRNPGEPLFTLLTSYAFGLCMLAGVFLTADSLSEEKREGTLGLLFLTDLHGYDVVLGKFIGRSLNAAYGLLALLPITAIPLLLGGVTGHEFWRMALALVNALFFSLAVGMWVSALSRESQAALSATFLLVLFAGAGLPVLARVLNQSSPYSPERFLISLSPFFAFMTAREVSFLGNPRAFWAALLIPHLLAWLFLALASVRLPLGIQQVPPLENGSFLPRLLSRIFGKALFRDRAPRKLLSINPVLWLIGNEPVLRRLLWTLVIIWAVVVCAYGPHWHRTPLKMWPPAKAWGFLLKMLVAVQASRFFVEARRSGALEVLLCTPLKSRDFIKGQFQALQRLFGWPLATFILLNFIPLLFQIHSTITSPSLTQFGDTLLFFAGSLGGIGLFTVGLLADFFAVAWVGMWLGLSLQRPALAPGLTILFVLILVNI